MINLLLQYILPQHILSRLVAKIANCRTRFLKDFLITQFCKFYNVDMSIALDPDLRNYQTFNDFFTRALRSGARPLSENESALVSPVDGRIWQIGQVTADVLISAKGRGFTVAQLLADTSGAAQYTNGDFAVLYLAPFNYHRIHLPVAGRLLAMTYISGALYSVNPNIVNNIPDVFAKNERVVLTFETAFGIMKLILVGAMIVGSVETVWHGVVMPNGTKKAEEWDYREQQLTFDRGVEIARFKLGSTVIILFPENSLQWDPTLASGHAIEMGQSLGIRSEK